VGDHGPDFAGLARGNPASGFTQASTKVLGAQPQPSGGGAVNPTVFFDAVVAALKVQAP